MTSIDFLNKVHKSLDSQEYNLSYSPAKSKNYMLYCNGNFIGGLFDEELCFVYADSVSELLGQPEPVYHGYSSTAQHRMLVIPEEHWAKALKLLYAEKFDWSRLVYDITYTSIGTADNKVERSFLLFCTGMAESHIFQSDGICHFGCYTYFFADTVYEVEFYLGKQDC